MKSLNQLCRTICGRKKESTKLNRIEKGKKRTEGNFPRLHFLTCFSPLRWSASHNSNEVKSNEMEWHNELHRKINRALFFTFTSSNNYYTVVKGSILMCYSFGIAVRVKVSQFRARVFIRNANVPAALVLCNQMSMLTRCKQITTTPTNIQ